tara:strand:- start:179 stop:601 length:423 start_codon:yes stop_codon:yes gene_type:complete
MIKLTYFYTIIFILIIFNLSAEVGNFQSGKNLFNDKKYDLAKFEFEKDIVFNPKNENSYLYLAKIYKIKKNDSLEESNLNTVILLNPENEEAIRNLALLKIRKSNYSETKKLILDLKKICKKLCSESAALQEKLDTALKK